ncbi:MAG: hypothetical protein JNM21_16925 [Taibaiella sp.]|nr:hypothetical protein [Taibaiella sp.]
MNYYNFIGYFFLLLIAAYAGNNEELEALKEEVYSIRKTTAIMRKELALVREEVANREDKIPPVNTADIATEQASPVIE